MHFPCLLWLNLLAIPANGIEFCPSGTLIIEKGLTPEYEDAVIGAHNRVRQYFVDGQVYNQPRAAQMKTLVYDQALAHKATPTTRQCANTALDVKDRRWPCVGQNTYLTCSSDFDANEYWDEAVEFWYSEHLYFVYPTGYEDNYDVSHYRQLVWADTDTFGCDFALFINYQDSTQPFCKIYVCNYCFCANSVANVQLAPYETAT